MQTHLALVSGQTFSKLIYSHAQCCCCPNPGQAEMSHQGQGPLAGGRPRALCRGPGLRNWQTVSGGWLRSVTACRSAAVLLVASLQVYMCVCVHVQIRWSLRYMSLCGNLERTDHSGL